jgi:hypothetical protein
LKSGFLFLKSPSKKARSIVFNLKPSGIISPGGFYVCGGLANIKSPKKSFRHELEFRRFFPSLAKRCQGRFGELLPAV